MYNNSPAGNYFYKRLPMGVANYPDIFQQKMNDLFHEFEYPCVHRRNFDLNKMRLDISCTEVGINTK